MTSVKKEPVETIVQLKTWLEKTIIDTKTYGKGTASRVGNSSEDVKRIKIKENTLRMVLEKINEIERVT
jgi:hypothetical protein